MAVRRRSVRTATASATFNTGCQVGGALAVAVYGALLANRDSSVRGQRVALLLAAAVPVAATAASRALPRPTPARPAYVVPPNPPSKESYMSEQNNTEPSGAESMFGGFASGLVHFTDDVLFGEAWERPELSPRDRSLVTVTALATLGSTEQLTFHLGLAKRNGVTEEELKEAITHLAFYAGWPRAMSAMAVAKQVFTENTD